MSASELLFQQNDLASTGRVHISNVDYSSKGDGKVVRPNDIVDHTSESLSLEQHDQDYTSMGEMQKKFMNKFRRLGGANDAKKEKRIGSSGPETNEREEHMREMRDIAFEVRMPDKGQNVHPLDRPLLLKNGGRISAITGEYESNSGTGSNATSSSNLPSKGNTSASSSRSGLTDDERKGMSKGIQVSMNDITWFAGVLWKMLYKLLLKLWNLDLFINVQKFDGSTMKLHIPSIICGFVCLHIIASLLIGNSTDSMPAGNYSSPRDTSSSKFISIPQLLTFTVVAVLIAYMTISMLTGSHRSSEHTVTTATPTSSSASISSFSKKSSSLEGRFGDGENTAITSYDVSSNAHGIPRTKSENIATGLTSRQHVPRRHTTPQNNLHVNKAIFTYRSGFSSSHKEVDVERMTIAGRSRMLSAFRMTKADGPSNELYN